MKHVNSTLGLRMTGSKVGGAVRAFSTITQELEAGRKYSIQRCGL